MIFQDPSKHGCKDLRGMKIGGRMAKQAISNMLLLPVSKLEA